MEVLRSRGFARSAHGLAMASFGAFVYVVLLALPSAEVIPAGISSLVVFVTITVILAELLWDRPLLLDQPILTGCCLCVAASCAFKVAIAAAMSPGESRLDVLGLGLSLGIMGVWMTFPFTTLLGIGGVILSDRMQTRLGVWDDEDEHPT